jgi:type 1 glutamine amidotransferase
MIYVQLGHDHLAHEHPAYRDLVNNAIQWAGGKLRPLG